MATFENIGAGWVNEKGHIRIKIDDEKSAGPGENLWLFRNKDKKADNHPDWRLTRIVDEEPEYRARDDPPSSDDDIPF